MQQTSDHLQPFCFKPLSQPPRPPPVFDHVVWPGAQLDRKRPAPTPTPSDAVQVRKKARGGPRGQPTGKRKHCASHSPDSPGHGRHRPNPASLIHTMDRTAPPQSARLQAYIDRGLLSPNVFQDVGLHLKKPTKLEHSDGSRAMALDATCNTIATQCPRKLTSLSLRPKNLPSKDHSDETQCSHGASIGSEPHHFSISNR